MDRALRAEWSEVVTPVTPIVDIDRQPAEVVTVYQTSKIEKYWRSEA